jgi:hypothetical protein
VGVNVINIIRYCPLVLVATAFRSEDGKFVGNKSICGGRGKKSVFGQNF